ncbi:MoxR-like ATPase [Anseongella ginsenosidimutans]|uniref:MoxR-like ATPase n=2 Tax=Anseongella ginsenosidimutans TaxID=496056 RepID=A0A4R3KUR7_9SPHI|nr:MoxR-like ATPase [Anseongella ginsenosidimutans]
MDQAGEPSPEASSTPASEELSAGNLAPDFPQRTDFSSLNESVQKIKEEFSRVVVGQDEVIELLIAAILADGHVLIEGVPGVAKTLMAKTLAKTLDTGFSRIQFTPDLMPSDVLGTSVFHPAKTQFEFRKGPIFSNVILIDEINRAPAKTQAALFEVMEERQVTNDGTTYLMDIPFLVVATQNPIEQEGTYRLPEAQLDRFLFKIQVPYPSLEEEIRILAGHHDVAGPASGIASVVSTAAIADAREKVRQVHVEPKLMEYIAKLVTGTRNNPFLFLGASPRASVALLNASKALAAIRGRDFITPEDIQELAVPVLCHRIQLTAEREMEGHAVEGVIKQIVQKLEVPR